MMRKAVFILLSFAFLLSRFGTLEAIAGNEKQILSVAQHMEAAFEKLEDYTCDVEQIFYRDGAENQRYLFKFYFKKEKKIRVDFSQPHSGLTLFYHDEDKEATVMPLRSLPGMKFRLSVNNPLLKTLAGQRISQTDMGYFIKFMFKNLRGVHQKENEFREENDRVGFLFWAMDYIEEKSPEKYRIFISKKHWLPIRIERYDSKGKRLEVTDIRDYILNAHLRDEFFLP